MIKSKEPDERDYIFVRLVMSGMGKTRAYKEAGYSSARGSDIKRLWNQPHVQEYVRELRDRAEIKPVEVLKVLRDQMHNDIGDLLDENGHFDYKTARHYGLTRQIKKLKIKERSLYTPDGDLEGVETTWEIEQYCAQSAAKTLADIIGMKTMPKLHPDDMKELKTLAERHIEEVMRFKGYEDRQQAVEYLIENQLIDPQYVM